MSIDVQWLHDTKQIRKYTVFCARKDEHIFLCAFAEQSSVPLVIRKRLQRLDAVVCYDGVGQLGIEINRINRIIAVGVGTQELLQTGLIIVINKLRLTVGEKRFDQAVLVERGYDIAHIAHMGIDRVGGNLQLMCAGGGKFAH